MKGARDISSPALMKDRHSRSVLAKDCRGADHHEARPHIGVGSSRESGWCDDSQHRRLYVSFPIAR